MNLKVCVWNSINSDKIAAGEHRFPFNFQVPLSAPPTFEGCSGFIRYTLKAKIDRPWKIDKHVCVAFNVSPLFDLNTIPYSALPSTKQTCKKVGFLFSKGHVDATVSIQKTGFVPGGK
jgi:hypothetical protein